MRITDREIIELWKSFSDEMSAQFLGYTPALVEEFLDWYLDVPVKLAFPLLDKSERALAREVRHAGGKRGLLL
jgi:hypothetical protein